MSLSHDMAEVVSDGRRSRGASKGMRVRVQDSVSGHLICIIHGIFGSDIFTNSRRREGLGRMRSLTAIVPERRNLRPQILVDQFTA